MNTCDEVRVSASPTNTITSKNEVSAVKPCNIRHCTVDEVANAPNIDALMAEYAQESHNAELPSPNVQFDHYRALEKMGLLQPICAFQGDELIGFVSVLASRMPHHGATLAMTESFFVTKQHRKGGAGLRLLRAAEKHAVEIDSPCLMVNTVHGSVLEQTMPKLGYRHANSTFVRDLRSE